MTENVRDIKIEDYDYPLPDSRIARHPLAKRDSCKLLIRNADGSVQAGVFTDITDRLPADTMLIYNNTRVINARMRFHKNGNGALIEIFCLEPVDPWEHQLNFVSRGRCVWQCFVGNSKRWKEGALSMPISVEGREITLKATRTGRSGNASHITFEWDDPDITFSQIIDVAGEIPIPPYLNRSTEESDTTDYQTIYSHVDGSVAAPTAGLHFTPEVFEALDAKGIQRRELTLHVGAGTFQPVKADNIGDHEMHEEFFRVSRSLITDLLEHQGPIVAVGTTSVRTLESLYHAGSLLSQNNWHGSVPQWYPYSTEHPGITLREALQAIIRYLDQENTDDFIGDTQLLIAPGYTYRVVDGIITNFHQPRSTLLLLVSAFVDGDWRAMYDYALDHDFRFLSYGDACLLTSQAMTKA